MYIHRITPAEITMGQVGSLYVLTGGMRGKKTNEFCLFFDGLRFTSIPFQLFKPKCDYRRELHERFGFPENYIVSRTGIGLPAVALDDKGQLEDLIERLDPEVRVYGFTEVHLYDHWKKMLGIILDLKERENNIPHTIVVECLDRDYRGVAYEITKELMGHATYVDKFFGVCEKPGCDNRGERTQKLIDGSPAPYDSDVKQVGDQGLYEVRCARDHIVPGKPPDCY